MKIVVQTQHRENYGAHDWDGQGECPQYWKFKGGNTYFVGCTLEEAQDKAFWERMEAALQSSDEYFEEYIIGSELIDECDFDPSAHCAEWESPIWVHEIGEGHFHCNRTIINDEYGYMRREIATKYESWFIGDNDSFKCHFTLRGDENETKYSYEQLSAVLKEVA